MAKKERKRASEMIDIAHLNFFCASAKGIFILVF